VNPTEKKVIVWLYLKDVEASNLVTSDFTVRLNKESVKYGSGILIDGKTEIIPIVSGYVELNLYDTTSMEPGSYYIFTLNGISYLKTIPDTLASSTILALPDYAP
jgi:hypothetical protein